MFKCIDCSFTSGLEEYYQHIQKWHHKNSFVCGQLGCTRLYFCIRTLKRHLKSHSDNNDNRQNDGASTSNYVYGPIHDNLPIFVEQTPDVFADSQPRSVFTPLAEIEKNYKLFVLSLYGDPSLDRKRAAFVSSSTSKIILDLLNTVKATAVV